MPGRQAEMFSALVEGGAFARSILFPVDFSPSALALAPAVAAMARRLNAPVTVIHATEALRLESEVADATLIAKLERHAREKLDSFGGEALAGVTVVVLVAGQIGFFGWILSQPHPRNMKLDTISRSDLMSLTREASEVSGIPFVMDAYRDEAMRIIEG